MIFNSDLLQQGFCESDCKKNDPYTTQAVQTRRRWDCGYRQSSSQLSPSYLLLNHSAEHSNSVFALLEDLNILESLG